MSHEKDIQVASLGSIANEVSVIYGLKPNPKFLTEADQPMQPEQVADAINSLYALRSSALTRRDGGGREHGIEPAGVAVRLDCGDDGSYVVACDGADYRRVWIATGSVQR